MADHDESCYNGGDQWIFVTFIFDGTLGTLLSLLTGSFAFGPIVGETKIITLAVSGARPLSKAVDKLEELSGIPINYEDVPDYYSTVLQDVTDAVARGGQASIRVHGLPPGFGRGLGSSVSHTQ